jgi:DNA-binding MarR family transcriptional regulator
MGISRVESTRHISQFLRISKSIVARVLIQLEEDGFISKVRAGKHPRQQYYVVAASKQECFSYRCYFGLSPFKRKKFLQELRTCGAKSLVEITKSFLNRGIEYYEESTLSAPEKGHNLPLEVGEEVEV